MQQSAQSDKVKMRHQPIPVVEDLFQEHAILRRLLVLFDRFVTIRSVDPRVLIPATTFFADFGAGYHAKTEEKLIFPIFAKSAACHVNDFKREHKEATAMVKQIASLAKRDHLNGLWQLIPAFTELYHSHSAREDLIIFAKLRPKLGDRRLHILSVEVEEFEADLLGENAFAEAVKMLNTIEVQYGYKHGYCR